MPIQGFSTQVKVSSTVDKVMQILAKAGVRKVQTTYGVDAVPEGLMFTIDTPVGPRDFALPVRAEGVLATLKRDRVEKRFLTMEQATRVAWRVALKWLEAQIALIDTQMATLPEVMLPYLVTGWDDAGNRPVTMYEAALDRGMKGLTA